jgi:hydrogenase large subunit
VTISLDLLEEAKMAKFTIVDPVTRIEGHMKVDVSIEQVRGENKVVDVACSGTLFRGFEVLLKGRDAWDAPVLTSRICGVCPVSHSMASVNALEKAQGLVPSPNGRIMRNLVLGSNFIQSHILHFYLLAFFDFVRGPAAAPWTPAWEVDMRDGLDALLSHLPQSLEARRRAHEMGAVFGGRMPLPHTYIPGGITAVPTTEMVESFRGHLSWLKQFIQGIYIPDVERIGTVYGDYFSIGEGCRNFLAFGVFELDETGEERLFKSGLGRVKAPGKTWHLDPARITESVAYSWYDDAAEGLAPEVGQTLAVDPLTKEDAYSWLKAPRYARTPFEVGPLARMWVNGNYRRGASVMDRHLARAQETLLIAQAMDSWLDEIEIGQSVVSEEMPSADGTGVGLTEAPRGALGHWVEIGAGRINHYQIITPTCWNASPRDSRGVMGPMEQAIKGLSVTDPDKPVEVLRVIHSFDPCLSCAVHVLRPGSRP